MVLKLRNDIDKIAGKQEKTSKWCLLNIYCQSQKCQCRLYLCLQSPSLSLRIRLRTIFGYQWSKTHIFHQHRSEAFRWRPGKQPAHRLVVPSRSLLQISSAANHVPLVYHKSTADAIWFQSDGRLDMRRTELQYSYLRYTRSKDNES